MYLMNGTFIKCSQGSLCHMAPGSHGGTFFYGTLWQGLTLERSAVGQGRDKQKVNQTHLNFRYKSTVWAKIFQSFLFAFHAHSRYRIIKTKEVIIQRGQQRCEAENVPYRAGGSVCVCVCVHACVYFCVSQTAIGSYQPGVCSEELIKTHKWGLGVSVQRSVSVVILRPDCRKAGEYI